MSRHRDHLIRESVSQADQIVALRLRIEDQAQEIASLKQELWQLQAMLAQSQKQPAIDPAASFGRAVAQLRQMFPGMEIEVTSKVKREYTAKEVES